MPVGVERQLADALDAVHGRGLLRQRNQFPAIGRYEQTVIGLQVSPIWPKGVNSLVGSKNSILPELGGRLHHSDHEDRSDHPAT